MSSEITLNKIGIRNTIARINQVYDILVENRMLLKDELWWADSANTGTKIQTLKFLLSNVLDSKITLSQDKKEIGISFSEHFFIMHQDQVIGLIGLYDACKMTKDSELYYLISHQFQGRGYASAALNLLENNCINNKNINSLHTKTILGNHRAEEFLLRNNYKLLYTENNTPISKYSDKLNDVCVWKKQLLQNDKTK